MLFLLNSRQYVHELEDKKIKEMEAILDKRIKIAMSKEKKHEEPKEEKTEIAYEEFQKLDIRIGTVLLLRISRVRTNC